MNSFSESDLGLFFMVGLGSTQLSEEELKYLGALKPCGIIIFSHNVAKDDSDWPNRLKSLLSEVKTAIGRKNIFIAIDHEGGRVHRLASPVTHFPSALYYRKQASAVGAAMGAELKELGFNLDFAPVLDIWSEEKNQVIGDRAFGKTSTEVSQYALSFALALEQAGVLACVKHFPGHGATVTDSHFELPIDRRSREEILQNDLKPFLKAISHGIKMVMTSHVLYPELDSVNPATTSEAIINGILRRALGFSGVVISDALEMGALSRLTEKEKILSALKAGVDILLAANPPRKNAIEIALMQRDLLNEAINAGEIEEACLSESAERINKVLSSLPLILDNDRNYGRQKQNITEFSVIGCSEHKELCQKIKENHERTLT